MMLLHTSMHVDVWMQTESDIYRDDTWMLLHTSMHVDLRFKPLRSHGCCYMQACMSTNGCRQSQTYTEMIHDVATYKHACRPMDADRVRHTQR